MKRYNWNVHNELKRCITFIGNDGEENLFTQDLEGYFCCQNEDHAKLISAAPDMESVLVSIWENKEFHNDLDNNTWLNIESALQKAGWDTSKSELKRM